MLIFACPGQGSQSEGFLIPWLEAYPQLEGVLSELSQSCGRDLMELGTVSSEEVIRDTANAQRLIVGASIGIFRVALSGVKFGGVVGHSVGEFAAAAVSGVLSDTDAMQLVGIRADAMAAAAAMIPTSMAAVLGGNEDDVIAKIRELSLEPANFNGGQIVAAGEKKAIEALVMNPPEKTRVVELKVAGAFHTSFMSSAVEKMQEAIASIRPKNPTVQLWSNSDGGVVESGEKFLSSLVEQIARPVRWDSCMKSIDQAENKVVELPPAGALTGLLKRGATNVTAIALKQPSDIEKISE